MPWKIEHRKDLVIWEVSGEVGVLDPTRVLRETCDSPEFVEGGALLVLDRSSDFNPSRENLLAMVEMWAAVFSRVAVCVERDLHYGLGRMLQAKSGKSVEFRIFRDETEARAWLGAQ